LKKSTKQSDDFHNKEKVNIFPIINYLVILLSVKLLKKQIPKDGKSSEKLDIGSENEENASNSLLCSKFLIFLKIF
jgi:hypothetical protein